MNENKIQPLRQNAKKRVPFFTITFRYRKFERAAASKPTSSVLETSATAAMPLSSRDRNLLWGLFTSGTEF